MGVVAELMRDGGLNDLHWNGFVPKEPVDGDQADFLIRLHLDGAKTALGLTPKLNPQLVWNRHVGKRAAEQPFQFPTQIRIESH